MSDYSLNTYNSNSSNIPEKRTLKDIEEIVFWNLQFEISIEETLLELNEMEYLPFFYDMIEQDTEVYIRDIKEPLKNKKRKIEIDNLTAEMDKMDTSNN
tara:strand:+ start:138 stop:434 length:297 start_codon:yes stop_codon:yes gene_type:complete